MKTIPTQLKKSLTHKGLIAGAALAFAPGLAAADDLAALEARIAVLESEKAAAPTIAAPGVKLSFYGYVKLDMIHDSDFDLGATTGGFAGLNALSVADGGSTAHAYESRFGVRGGIDTDIGEVKFNLEGDFFGGGGGTFRLRHAYGEVGPLLAGQTWATWMPFEGGPPNIQDFNGAAGGSNYRTPQIRYTFKPSDQWRFSLALEEDPAPGSSSQVNLAAFAGYSAPKFRVGAGMIARSLETAANASVNGRGYALGVDVDAWQGGKLHLQYVGGKGIGTALANNGFSAIEVGTLGKYAFDIDSAGNAIGVKALKAGVTQKFGEKFDISLSHGMQTYDSYAGALPDYTKKLSSTYLTARYFATKSVMLAAEVAHSEREQFDGTSFDNTRVQGVVKFTF